MQHFGLAALKVAYARGENITHLLRQGECNDLQAIELAYDLQAGSYTRGALADIAALQRRATSMAQLLQPHVQPLDVLLDCGSGELTTLSALSQHLSNGVKLLAFDISLSRLNAGRRFAQRFMCEQQWRHLELFAAGIGQIPLGANSVDVVLTSHALEPNYGREPELLAELLRVSRRKLVLFEPSYEDNTQEGQARMRELGYIRDLPAHIAAAGGRLLSKTALPDPINPLNPTYCYIVEKSPSQQSEGLVETRFLCPQSGAELERRDGYLWSSDGGYAYPMVNGIALLRESDAILMCHD